MTQEIRQHPKRTQPASRPSSKPGAARTDRAQEPEVLLLEAALSEQPFDARSRHSMISEAAYFRAAQRGFEPGRELDDWLAAEAEVNARLCGDT